MRRINILLASAERRTSNALEAMVLDVCYEQVVAEITRTARIDELVNYGSRDGVALILITADHLLAEPSRRGAMVTNTEVLRAIRLIREHRTTPILAATLSSANEPALVDAGADFVSTGVVLNSDHIKPQLRRFLQLTVLAEQVSPARCSFGAWLRGYLRLKSA